MAGITFFDSKECEWADMSFFIGGAPVAKIQSVRYKRTKEKKALHGAGNKAISIQSGNETIEGSVGLLKGALDDLNAAAQAAGGESVLDVSVDAVITYKPAPGRPLKTDTIVGLEFTEYEKSWEQGADHMMINTPFVALDLND